MNENMTNTPKDFMTTSFGDEKANKSTELNEGMSIVENTQDEYEQTLHNLGGKE